MRREGFRGGGGRGRKGTVAPVVGGGGQEKTTDGPKRGGHLRGSHTALHPKQYREGGALPHPRAMHMVLSLQRLSSLALKASPKDPTRAHAAPGPLFLTIHAMRPDRLSAEEMAKPARPAESAWPPPMKLKFPRMTAKKAVQKTMPVPIISRRTDSPEDRVQGEGGGEGASQSSHRKLNGCIRKT